MSATRRSWRKGRAISTRRRILLAGHGAPRHAAAQQSIIAQAAALAAATGAVVQPGFLTAEPSVASAVSALGEGPVTVLPMFMADGYLVRTAVPRALGRSAQILPPLGVMPGLAAVISTRARSACAATGIDPASSTLLLVGHGSARSDASRRAVLAQARLVADMALFRMIETAFIEEAPSIDDQCRQILGDVVVMGFFAAPGGHASEDVPRLIADDPWGATRRLVYAGAVGADPAIVPLLADAITGIG